MENPAIETPTPRRETVLGSVVTLLERSAQSRQEMVALVGNKFPRLSYREFFETVERLAAGFSSLGISPGHHVALVSENRDLWLLCDLALLSLGAVDVPRGGDAPAPEVEFCVGHAACRAAIVESAALLEKLGSTRSQLEPVVILQGEAPAGTVSIDEVLERGARLLRSDPLAVRRLKNQVTPDHLATVIYTSGTTGNPKGVMLTHGNLLHNVRMVPEILHLRPGGRFVSFLPSWHSFERVVEYVALDSGVEIHYSNKRTLKQDLLRVQPNFLVGVPRVWETFFSQVTLSIGKLKTPVRQIVKTALELSRVRTNALRRLRGLIVDERGAVHREGPLRRASDLFLGLCLWPAHKVADVLIYRKLRNALGGCKGPVVSGGGALPAHIDEFLTRAGVLLLNGYGLTESSPVIAVRRPERNVIGTIGPPIPETEVRVVDEHGHDLGRMNRGVIQARGPQIMRGYHANASATERALPGEGWLDTGDVGLLTSAGDVIITGRAKDTIVLSGGENVEPEPLEAEVCRSPYVADVLIVGHGRKALGALLVPEWEPLCRALDLPPTTAPTTLAADKRVQDLLRGELTRAVSPQRGFRPWERIGRQHILSRPFSIEDGTLTQTFKKRRDVIERLHSEDIETLFQG